MEDGEGVATWEDEGCVVTWGCRNAKVLLFVQLAMQCE